MNFSFLAMTSPSISSCLHSPPGRHMLIPRQQFLDVDAPLPDRRRVPRATLTTREGKGGEGGIWYGSKMFFSNHTMLLRSCAAKHAASHVVTHFCNCL